MSEPETRPNGLHPSLTSSPYSEWSDPRNLGPTINTAFAEQQATLSKDGLTLYFSSNRPTDEQDGVLEANIWVSERSCADAANSACAWQPPKPLGPEINTPVNDANPNLSRDGHRLFITSTRRDAGWQGSNDLWVSYRENVHEDFGPRGWQTPVNLGTGVNSSFNEAAANYFENDELSVPQLYFNRQTPPMMPDGDIYMSAMQPDGTWGTAERVDELNSPFVDQRSSIHHSGLEIFFWSNRTGESHIWHAVRESVLDPWSAPEMVGPPISNAQSTIPFIYSHGETEMLFLVRDVGAAGSPNLDLFVSTRTRGAGGQ